MVAFKETIRRNPFRGEHIYHERKDLKYKKLIHKEIFFWFQWCAAHRRDHFGIELLGEMDTEFENTLACLSGTQMGLNHEKNGVENLVTHSH